MLPLVFLSTSLHYNAIYSLPSISTIDPDIAYLLNFLDIIRFQQITHVDHPGTPYDIFGALVIKGYNLFTARDDFTAVLGQPVFYLSIVRAAVFYVTAGLHLLIGFMAYHYSGRLSMVFLLQLTPFLSRFFLWRAISVNVDGFFLVVLPLVVIALLKAYYDDSFLKRTKSVAIFAFPFALGVATKFTALILLLIPLMLIQKWSLRFVFLVSFGVSLLLFLLPALPLTGYMLQWIWGLLIHSGMYGAGTATVIDTQTYPSALWHFLNYEPYLYCFSFVAFAFSFIIKEPVKTKLFLRAICLSQFVGLLVIAKHPSGHYTIPFIYLSGIIIYFLFCGIYEFSFYNRAGKERLRYITLCMATVLLLFAIDSGYWNMRGAVAGERRRVHDYQLLREQLQHKYESCGEVYSIFSLNPLAGIHIFYEFGSHRDTNDRQNILNFYKQQPSNNRFYYYDVWGKQFFDSSRKQLSLNAIKRRHTCVALVNFSDALPSSTKVAHEGEFFKLYIY